MRPSSARGAGIVSALACVLTTFGITGAAHAATFPTASNAGRVVGLNSAGILYGWGASAGLSVPSSLDGVPVTSISMGSGWALATTAAGKVVTWGADSTIAPALPASIDPSTMRQLSAAGSSAAAAVTSDGHVRAWLGGDTSTAGAWLDTSGLTDVASIALGQQEPYGVALAGDGTVKTWGIDAGSGNVTSPVPGTLTSVQGVAACDATGLALTSDGGVHAWGSDASGLVSNAPAPDATNPVLTIACAGNTGIATRRDGSIAEWGDTSGANAIPASLTTAVAGGARVSSIAASSGGIVARVAQGELWAWGSPTLTGASLPTDLTGAMISELAAGSGAVYALTTAAVPLNKPTITGTGAVGQGLNATDAAFSGGVSRFTHTISGQWFRDGAPIPGATSTVYVPQGSDGGKTLTYRNTAVVAGSPPGVAESDPITVGRTSSALSMTTYPGSYGHASSVTVKVASAAGASGPVSLSVDGASGGTAMLAHGSATFRLPARLAAGVHMVGATYRGNSASGGATCWGTLTIAKATSHTKVTLPKKARKGGHVKAVVKVRAGVRATGTVTVKIGKAKGYASVVRGKAIVKLKVAKKPHQKVVAIYSGDNNVRGSRGHTKL